MQQYHELLKNIKKFGSYKSPARKGMPGGTSLFGYQFRHNLSEGFPLLTTKKMYWKGVVIELLWFLKGYTNIKYLIDNGCNIWNGDAYNYYQKLCKKNGILKRVSFEDFIQLVKGEKVLTENLDEPEKPKNYVWGECGKQYGWLWRHWECLTNTDVLEETQHGFIIAKEKDQLLDLINGLKENPESRRHIITAWNPATIDDMALPACHSFVQFNVRKISSFERENYYAKTMGYTQQERYEMNPNCTDDEVDVIMDNHNIPKYYLDCQLYQRSADAFLGVPFNIASYSLLIHIIAKYTNMIPGEFIHTFGDAHIYDNHINAVEEQLTRDYTKYKLPEVRLDFDSSVDISNLEYNMFNLLDYQSYPSIKAELSTGMGN
jgi:thymidylate synthase